MATTTTADATIPAAAHIHRLFCRLPIVMDTGCPIACRAAAAISPADAYRQSGRLAIAVCTTTSR